MGVRQLAGPFPIVNDLGEAPSSIGGWTWVPNIGVVADLFQAKGRIVIDGVYQPTGYQTPSVSTGWWPDQHRLVYLKFVSSGIFDEYVYDPLVLMPKLLEEGISIFINNEYVKLLDRRLYYAQGIRAIDLAGVNTIEISQADLGLLNTGSVGPGRHDNELFIGCSYGGLTRARFYDTLKKEVSSVVYHVPMESLALAFAPEFGVMVSLHDAPFALRVWSFEVEPVTLSAPELVPPGLLKEGYLPTFRVQALGAHDDPCEGELIDWTLESPDSPASSPPETRGRLLLTQSLTDADGWAKVRVRYGVGDAGASVISASLKC